MVCQRIVDIQHKDVLYSLWLTINVIFQTLPEVYLWKIFWPISDMYVLEERQFGFIWGLFGRFHTSAGQNTDQNEWKYSTYSK